eukprot:768281-Hanusia_phi.AAC.7
MTTTGSLLFETYPAPGVIATSPEMAPLMIPRTLQRLQLSNERSRDSYLGRFLIFHSVNIHDRDPVAAEICEQHFTRMHHHQSRCQCLRVQHSNGRLAVGKLR